MNETINSAPRMMVTYGGANMGCHLKMNSYSRGMNSRNRHLGRHAWAYRCVAPDGGAATLTHFRQCHERDNQLGTTDDGHIRRSKHGVPFEDEFVFPRNEFIFKWHPMFA